MATTEADRRLRRARVGTLHFAEMRSAAWIAKELGVGVRTVERDIAHIKEHTVVPDREWFNGTLAQMLRSASTVGDKVKVVDRLLKVNPIGEADDEIDMNRWDEDSA